MPRNIIDKLALWIPNKEKREQFRFDINKTVIDSFINNQEEFKSRYPRLYKNVFNNIIENIISLKKIEIMESFPDLYHHITNTKTRHSDIVTKYLSGLKGIEIGGGAHADFGINAIKIDRIDISKNDKNLYSIEQMKKGGFIQDVDIIADGDNLPFKDSTVDFVFTSHVLEHFFDPIKALEEWYRITKKGGYIFMIVPHKERTFDKDRERTTLQELIGRHDGSIKSENQNTDMHHSVWITEDLLELCKYLNYNVVDYQDTDDAVGNGFTIVIQK